MAKTPGKTKTKAGGKDTAEETQTIAPKVQPSEKLAASEKEYKPRLRIKLRAYDHKIIDTAARQIVETALRNVSEVHGPVPLPTEFHRYTVNRSTFVHKDAREQFELRVHRRLIIIPNPSPKLVSALTSLTLPSGVDVEIKTM
jgi:small subunit ribosomal protein S10